MPDTFDAYVRQFLRPDGREHETCCPLPWELQALYMDMINHDCHFQAETLTTGEVSVTISNGDEDIDISITPNGPEVQAGMVAMLKRQRWLE